MKFCKICHCKTLHKTGSFKFRKIEGELFELTMSTTEALKNLSSGFNQHVHKQQEQLINSQTPLDYINADNGQMAISYLFTNSIRASKCIACGHLIKLSRLP